MTDKELVEALTKIVREMIASYSTWPIMAHGDKTYAPRVAEWLGRRLAEIGYKSPVQGVTDAKEKE